MAAPLEGIRILDLSRLLPGPYCTMMLADLGAEVIKIEEPNYGDPVRLVPPRIKEESALFLTVNRNKKSVTLNLKDPRGVEAFLKMVETADLIIEGFRPGVVDRLGIGYPAASAVNPKPRRRGMAALRTLSGSQRISIRSTPPCVNASWQRAAAVSVANPWPHASVLSQ